MRALLSFILIITALNKLYSQNKLEKYFADAGVIGSITIYDYKNQKWIMSESIDAKLATVPASTFKILNLLIALETGTIASEQEIIRWPGSIDTAVYGYRPSTYKDMTVKEAFEVSAGWVFIALAKKIGREKYLHYLQACDYGNKEISTVADFWNFGPLTISPYQQIEFLKKVYTNKTPFSKRNIEILKNVMINESDQNYVLRGKTGWGWQNGLDAGWWVGYFEKDNNALFFATRLIKERIDKNPNFQKSRRSITEKIIADLGLL